MADNKYKASPEELAELDAYKVSAEELEALEEPEIGTYDAWRRALAEGLTLGKSDEIVASISAAKDAALGEGDYKELYDKYLTGLETDREALEKQHPVVAEVGEAVGSMALPGGAAKGARGLITGGITGATEAYSKAEDMDFTDRLLEAGKGFVGSLVGGGVVRGAGKAVARPLQKAKIKSLEKARRQAAEEIGVPKLKSTAKERTAAGKALESVSEKLPKEKLLGAVKPKASEVLEKVAEQKQLSGARLSEIYKKLDELGTSAPKLDQVTTKIPKAVEDDIVGEAGEKALAEAVSAADKTYLKYGDTFEAAQVLKRQLRPLIADARSESARTALTAYRRELTKVVDEAAEAGTEGPLKQALKAERQTYQGLRTAETALRQGGGKMSRSQAEQIATGAVQMAAGGPVSRVMGAASLAKGVLTTPTRTVKTKPALKARKIAKELEQSDSALRRRLRKAGARVGGATLTQEED